MSNLRIVSFLPAATEMLFALGLGDQLVGVSHECDFPLEAKTKPVVVRPALPLSTMNLREIDDAVTARLRAGQSIYAVDEQLLRSLAPDLIITQDLCQVCAPSGNEVTQALNSLPKKPKILYLTPHSIADILDNIRQVGAATQAEAAAAEVIERYETRLQAIRCRSRELSSRPHVFCCEWIDPVYCSGHWIPEMVGIAGGLDVISRLGSDSVRIDWEAVLKWSPEVIVVMPCGFGTKQAVKQTQLLSLQAQWSSLPAVKNNRVFAVDANSYFARPGPRIIDGVELLAHLFHPDVFPWRGKQDAFERVQT